MNLSDLKYWEEQRAQIKDLQATVLDLAGQVAELRAANGSQDVPEPTPVPDEITLFSHNYGSETIRLWAKKEFESLVSIYITVTAEYPNPRHQVRAIMTLNDAVAAADGLLAWLEATRGGKSV